MPSLTTRCAQVSGDGPTVVKVLTAGELAEKRFPAGRCVSLGPDRGGAGAICAEALPAPAGWAGWWLAGVADPGLVRPGNVVAIDPRRSTLRALWRRGANGNALFATGRCNSLCLMCSQPPRADDPDRLREMLETVALVDPDEPQLGITGGEPLLVEDLPVVVAACRDRLPRTRLHVLTNGRRFAEEALVRRYARLGHPGLVWAVPLYADLPELHDWVVQAEGAFAETLRGLAHLAAWRQRVELRGVLHRPALERLGRLAAFIARHLPFVEHVALMGLEATGFARANRDLLRVGADELAPPLTEAAWHLANRGLRVSVYNLPLCALPPDVRPFARPAISDWKRVQAPACAYCAASSRCGGVFAWDGGGWLGAPLRPLTAGEAALAREHDR
jgi:His-Xaa-Ser system radical SAM maturase HxsC